jgi:hypothetical protein
MKAWRSTTVVLGLLALAVVARVLPHPHNFTPILGIALFAGSRFDSRRLALGVPILAMVLGDLILGWHSAIPYVYAPLLLLSFAGWQWLKPARFGWGRLGLMAGGSSVLFFLLSNFGVWITQALYPKTGAGLAACYIAGLPFFPATLASTFIYSFALFALAAIADQWSAETAPARAK